MLRDWSNTAASPMLEYNNRATQGGLFITINTMPRKTLLLIAWLASHALAQTDVRGIFVYTNDVALITNATASQLTQSFSIPGVDGAAIVIGWDAVEPSLGQYQWTLLDQWIAQLTALGKKIDLVVPAGSAIPSWLFLPPPAGAGAQELQFTITPHGGATSVCQADNIAAPWDPAFLKQWDSMLAALSAHLHTTGTYNAATLVRSPASTELLRRSVCPTRRRNPRERLRSDERPASQWIVYPEWHPLADAGHSDRRHHGNGPVRRSSSSWGVSIQRSCTGIAGQRRPNYHRNVWRRVHPARYSPDDPQLMSG